MVLKILVAIVAAFAAFVALQPSEYRIARSATIAAPASDVFAQVNDFHKWDAWSPWAKLDPNAKTTFGRVHVQARGRSHASHLGHVRP